MSSRGAAALSCDSFFSASFSVNSMSFFQISSCPTTQGGILWIICIQVVPFHQRPLTAISLCSKRLCPIACMRRICRRDWSRIRPCSRRASSSGEGMRTTRERLAMPGKIFA
jgi:hypothetical protein